MSGAGDPAEADAVHAFAVECPGCRAHVAVAGDLAGRQVSCPLCHAVFLVPDPAATAQATPAVPGVVGAGRKPVAPPHDRPPVPDRSPAVERATSPDEPVVFAEPPLPSTRRRADEPWSHVAAEATAETPAYDGVSIPAPPPDADDDGMAGLAFREPVKTVRSGGTEIELRRLTPEERRTRRARRNLIMLVVGAALLVALVVLLGTRGQ